MNQEELEERKAKAQELIGNLKWGAVMESMEGDEIKERINFGVNFPIPHQPTPVPYLGRVDQLTDYIFYELVARCPVTGIKDLYKVIFRFVPDRSIPELKSLKFYLMDYEEYKVPISHEHLADKLYNEFNDVVKPKDLYVELQTAERGEICTTTRVGNLDLAKYEEKPFIRN